MRSAFGGGTRTAEAPAIGRRADVLAAYTALRNGILAHEQEVRDELARTYAHYTRDAQQYVERLPAMRGEWEQRHAALAQREAERALLRSRVTVEDETKARTALAIREERARMTFVRLNFFEYTRVRTIEKLQQLGRAEDRKRYALERSEAADFGELAFAYSQTPWKPTIKALGQCPFARRAHCPFADRWRMCHGMPLAENHYQLSAVDTVSADMM